MELIVSMLASAENSINWPFINNQLMANIIFADRKSVDTSSPPSMYDAVHAQTAVLLVLSDNLSSQSPQS